MEEEKKEKLRDGKKMVLVTTTVTRHWEYLYASILPY